MIHEQPTKASAIFTSCCESTKQTCIDARHCTSNAVCLCSATASRQRVARGVLLECSAVVVVDVCVWPY